MADPAVQRLTYAEYLALEAISEERHAYADGEIYTMSGGTRVQAALQMRLGAELFAALRGRPCVPYGPDLRIFLPHLGEACYADVVVVCGRFLRDAADPDATVNPALIVEVLSPSTEGYDRGRKFEKYRGLESVREYVLVAQDRPAVDLYRREADGTWRLVPFRQGDHVQLGSVGVTLSVDALYDGVFDEGEGAA